MTQFSLRDLLWLILLIACNLGWYNSRVRPVRLLQDQIGNQQWEIAFHKKQVAIEREATKRTYDYLTDSRLREHRLKAENKSLKEQMRVGDSPYEADPKEVLYGDWEIIEWSIVASHKCLASGPEDGFESVAIRFCVCSPRK